MAELREARCPVHRDLLARYPDRVEVRCRKCKKIYRFDGDSIAVLTTSTVK